MGLSYLSKAAKSQLQRIMKAWCIIVEGNAKLNGISKSEVERQLTGGSVLSSHGDFRQLDRWKKNQVPTGDTFANLNELAVENKWMQKNLSQLFVSVYVARSGVLVTETNLGWDQMGLWGNCLEYGLENKLSLLVDHCKEWLISIKGPDLNCSSDIHEQYLKENADYYDMINNQNISDEVELELSRLLEFAYSLGLKDPFPLLAKLVKQHKYEWPNTVKIFEKDYLEFGKRNRCIVNYMLHCDSSDDEKPKTQQFFMPH